MTVCGWARGGRSAGAFRLPPRPRGVGARTRFPDISGNRCGSGHCGSCTAQLAGPGRDRRSPRRVAYI
jgi:hypothetical protein